MRVETKEPSIHQSISAESGNPEGAGSFGIPGGPQQTGWGGATARRLRGRPGHFQHPMVPGEWQRPATRSGPIYQQSDASDRSPRRRARPMFGEATRPREGLPRDVSEKEWFPYCWLPCVACRQVHGQRVCEMKRITAAPHALGNLSENQADLIKKACVFAVGAQ